MDHLHDDDVLLCPDCDGRWLIETESGSAYALDLDARTVTRANTGWWRRRDTDVLPLLDLEPVRVGERWTLLLGDVDDYPGYLTTTRNTTPVVRVTARTSD